MPDSGLGPERAEREARARAHRSPRVLVRLWEESGLRNTGQMLRALMRRGPDGAPLLHRARAIRVPTLILVGLHDRNVGVDSNRDVASVIPDAKLVLFDHSAHFPDIDETGKYAATVRDFLGW
jgi:proline iminopeptidase